MRRGAGHAPGFGQARCARCARRDGSGAPWDRAASRRGPSPPRRWFASVRRRKNPRAGRSTVPSDVTSARTSMSVAHALAKRTCPFPPPKVEDLSRWACIGIASSGVFFKIFFLPLRVAHGRWDGSTGPQAREAARGSALLVSFLGGGGNGCMQFPWFPALPERGRARPRRSAATQSHQPPPARASFLGAPRCWLVTTPSRCSVGTVRDRAQIHTKRLPGLAQNGYQDSAYLAVAPRLAGAHWPPDPPAGDPVAGRKKPKSPSSGAGTSWRRPSHS